MYTHYFCLKKSSLKYVLGKVEKILVLQNSDYTSFNILCAEMGSMEKAFLLYM